MFSRFFLLGLLCLSANSSFAACELTNDPRWQNPSDVFARIAAGERVEPLRVQAIDFYTKLSIENQLRLFSHVVLIDHAACKTVPLLGHYKPLLTMHLPFGDMYHSYAHGISTKNKAFIIMLSDKFKPVAKSKQAFLNLWSLDPPSMNGDGKSVALLMRKVLKTKKLGIGREAKSLTIKHSETYDDLAMIALFVAMGGKLDNECGIEPLPDFMFSNKKSFFRGYMVVRKEYILEVFAKTGSPAGYHPSRDLAQKYMPIDFEHCLPART